MASRIESTPCDVLQHIAFFVASSSFLEPPHHLINFLLASSTIYSSLRISNCPSLYADIFRAKFDLVASIHGCLTDSALSVELIRRCLVMRRARCQDLSLRDARQNLFAALQMVLESRFLNGAQLIQARFPEFIVSFVCQHLSTNDGRYAFDPLTEDTNSLAIWLLCFTLSRRAC